MEVKLTPMDLGPRWEATHTHVKSGGKYRVLYHGILEKTLSPVVIYQGEDGVVWVRPDEEFYDGRFKPIPDSR